MSLAKEIAKFACGAEAFHACMHGYLWLSGTNLEVFGIHQTPLWNALGGVINGLASLSLGIYAWRGAGRSAVAL